MEPSDENKNNSQPGVKARSLIHLFLLTWMFENIHGWSPAVPSHLVLHRPSLMGCFWSLWQSSPRCSPHIAFLGSGRCRLPFLKGLSWEADNVDSLFLKDLDMILRSSPAGRHCPWCLWVHVQLSVTRHCLVYRHFVDMWPLLFAHKPICVSFSYHGPLHKPSILSARSWELAGLTNAREVTFL